MLHFLREQCLNTNQQYGFIARRSTTLNLLDALNDWLLAIDNKFSVAVGYIDNAKAFDAVSPPKLCHKLKAYGISGNLLSWIADLLCGRSQQTRVGSALSDVKTLISGVIQGSCLGPLLFVLYVNMTLPIFFVTVLYVKCMLMTSNCILSLRRMMTLSCYRMPWTSYRTSYRTGHTRGS
jgi:Reverse transcriptase (RNA-dependent DNA polymerase)